MPKKNVDQIHAWEGGETFFFLVNKEFELIGFQLVGFYWIITFLFRYHITDGIM